MSSSTTPFSPETLRALSDAALPGEWEDIPAIGSANARLACALVNAYRAGALVPAGTARIPGAEADLAARMAEALELARALETQDWLPPSDAVTLFLSVAEDLAAEYGRLRDRRDRRG